MYPQGQLYDPPPPTPMAKGDGKLAVRNKGPTHTHSSVRLKIHKCEWQYANLCAKLLLFTKHM